MTWEFEHSVEARAEPARAWQFWTNVENWTLDPAVEWARLDGPFRAGARGTTKQRGQDAVRWQVADVQEGRGATIEVATPGGTARFAWRFEPVAGGRTRLTQRVTLDGAAAAAWPAEARSAFAEGVRAMMGKIAAAMAEAACDGPRRSAEATPPETSVE
jgi:hypothetical protein